ncbi:MAG: alpha/beta hydrolase [Betaproteobacteria bacterium]|nr:alpha/beta hydrolase [Betaproteobacteria bacterium]
MYACFMAASLFPFSIEPDEIGQVILPLSSACAAFQNPVSLRWASWGKTTSALDPSMVLLHEGLGSIRQWRHVPSALHQNTKLKVIAFERVGYGASSTRLGPWPVQFMHEEADFLLPAFLNALSIKDPILLGHSDGASIALLAAGALRPRALICIAAHVFVESICRDAIYSLLESERKASLLSALSKYHPRSESLLQAWSTVWLSQAFKSWDIRDRLRSIDSPVLAIQARDDAYGTMAQLEAIEENLNHPRCLRLERGGHSPHLDKDLGITDKISDFIQKQLNS